MFINFFYVNFKLYFGLVLTLQNSDISSINQGFIYDLSLSAYLSGHQQEMGKG